MAKLLHFAQKAIIEKGNKVLVIENPNDGYNPGMIHFPGGRMNFGESVDDHIKREILEETSVKIQPLEPLDITSWIVSRGQDKRRELQDNDLQVVAVIRRCKYLSGQPTLENNTDDEHLEKIYWVDPKKLVKNKNFDKKLLPALKQYLKL